MAMQANISVTESQFRCPICLELLGDPVSIPCGHTYCMPCINRYWDQVDPGGGGGGAAAAGDAAASGSSPFRCPQCREPFSPRPVLRRNTVLAELLDRLKLSSSDAAGLPLRAAGVGDVPCDFCPVDGKLKAAKSCLVCLASFCEMHVLPHREVGTLRRHRLVAAVESPAERLCAQHRLGLEPHSGGGGGGGPGGEGGSDAEAAAGWTGDCLLCEADHEEAPGVEGQRARRQLQLQESQRLLQCRTRTAERDLEEFEQSLESFKASAAAVLEDSEALFADMAARLEKVKAEVRTRLEAKERAVVGRAQQEVEALHRETFSAARKALCHLRSRLEEVSREEADKISRAVNENCVSGGECVKAPVAFDLSSVSLQPSDQRMRAAFLRYSCDLSLDPDTAHPTLVLLAGPSAGAHCGEEPQAYPPHPQRFDSVAQVLCREGQFSGVSYWEVEWRGGGWVDVGVTYRGIGRKGGGKPCLLGRNEHSWRLRCTHTGYSAWHDNRKTTVASPPCPRLAVFLERHRGALSFYSVSDTLTLLHTFQGPFSQPLYPAFRLDLDATLVIHPPPCGTGGGKGTPP
ncbi:hypothetical protein CRUP_025695 [Coryphaenoides rupestris]|nr:hypothetical protein CRUP_025695 [Coryphaenoides rupestris]